MTPCCIADCDNPGSAYRTGHMYCAYHLRELQTEEQMERQKREARAAEPVGRAEWNVGDILRAHGAGATVDVHILPAVSKQVEDECRKELEEAARNGYQRS